MSSKDKGKGSAGKETQPSKNGRQKQEKPVSKFHDLVMRGVKPWDPDANEFYDGLVQARRELDAFYDKESKKKQNK